MRKRSVSEADVESAAHKGAERVQETWEEFKEKANKPFEEALEKVTGQSSDDAVSGIMSFVKRYRTPLLIGAGVILAAVVAGRLMSSDEVNIDLGEDLES